MNTTLPKHEHLYCPDCNDSGEYCDTCLSGYADWNYEPLCRAQALEGSKAVVEKFRADTDALRARVTELEGALGEAEDWIAGIRTGKFTQENDPDGHGLFTHLCIVHKGESPDDNH